jgi:hypothetical protein
MAAELVKSAGAEGFVNRLYIGLGDIRKRRESVEAQQRGGAGHLSRKPGSELILGEIVVRSKTRLPRHRVLDVLNRAFPQAKF